MKVLVTGAAGFLGKAIVKRLQQGPFEIRAFVRPGRVIDDSVDFGGEIFEGDICEETALEAALDGVDAVVHAAALVATSGSWESFAEANIRATQKLIKIAGRKKVGRIVHISSLSVYAVPENNISIDEDSSYESESNGRGAYSRSKLAADRLALHEAKKGAPVVVLRPGLLYGPGKKPPLARQSFAVAGFRLLLARPGYQLPMSYVENVADAVALALEAPNAVGHAYTIVDENISQKEYLSLYRSASGQDLKAIYLPVPLVASAARVAEKVLALARKKSPVTYHQVRRATDSAEFRTTRAREDLHWAPAVDVAEGLRRSFATSDSASSAQSSGASS